MRKRISPDYGAYVEIMKRAGVQPLPYRVWWQSVR